MWDAGVLDRCAAAGRRVMAEHDVIRWRETRGMVGGVPEGVVAAEPLPGGLSGGELARLTLAAHTAGESRWYASRVLKRVRPCAGWLGAASADTLAREARLWSSGVLADLPAPLATGILASAQGPGDGSGALLMRHPPARPPPHPPPPPPRPPPPRFRPSPPH